MSNPFGRRLALAALPAAIASLALASPAKAEPWPNLNDAEDHLRLALDSLRRAPDRFGGHKHEAIRLIEGALDEIEQSKRSFR